MSEKKLKKELSLFGVYAIATGTTLSGGLFLLPGLAAKQSGPAMILAYALAAIPLIPAMLCKIELATAMPRAGGTYYFLDRSMGPLVGTIGGFGTWLSLVLKTAFALIGMGAYLSLYISGDYTLGIAVGFAVFFGALNLIGSKEAGSIQAFLLIGILSILGVFIGKGVFHINPDHFNNFFAAGTEAILGTAGFVFISYVGIVKVASISEEVKDPEKNLPRGMILAFITSFIIYMVVVSIMVGVLPMEYLMETYTPVADVADYMMGKWGKVAVTIAAVFAFSSVTNAGILSASRFPLAMSRDHLIPERYQKVNGKGIPVSSVVLTVVSLVLVLIFFDASKIAKLASSFQLIVLSLCCLAVVIMRESHIEAYDPGYKSPFYPWLPIIGIITPYILIFEMGAMPMVFSFILIIIGTIWYFAYARKHVSRGGAILHVFERWGRRRYEGLEPELRGILIEKGLRDHDPFDELVTRAKFVDLDNTERFDSIIKKAAVVLSEEISYPAEKIEEEFFQGTKIGATPVSHGVALPHMRVNFISEPVLLLVRARKGIDANLGEEFWGAHAPEGDIYAVFFLVSPEDNPGQHLRILAKIAGRVDDDNFLTEWLKSSNDQDIKELLLRDEHFISLVISTNSKSKIMIAQQLKDIKMPDNTLIAIIRRKGATVVPRGNTSLEKGDRLTIIGDRKGIKEFKSLYE